MPTLAEFVILGLVIKLLEYPTFHRYPPSYRSSAQMHSYYSVWLVYSISSADLRVVLSVVRENPAI